MDRVRVGFIGAGRIADLHRRAYVDNPTGELVAVADSAPGRAEARRRQWGLARAYADYRELLDDAGVDAVEILLPHHLHMEAAVAALDAGKHVSLQKPFALSLAEADAVIAAAARSGRLFRVFENFLNYEPYIRAGELVDAGEIGQPVSIRAKVVGGKAVGGWQVPEEAWEWRFDPQRGGGPPAIYDHGHHTAAVVVRFMGPVEKVYAMTDATPRRGGQFAGGPGMIVWKHAGGQRYGSWEMTRAPELRIKAAYYGGGDEITEVTGTRGIVWVNRGSADMLGLPPVSLYRDGQFRHYSDMETDWGDSFRRGGRAFTDAIVNGAPIGLSGAEALTVLAFQLAAIRSAVERREVAVAEIERDREARPGAQRR